MIMIEPRGHDQKLFKKRFRLNVKKYAFSNRVIDNWNLLPARCIKCSTIVIFERGLSFVVVVCGVACWASAADVAIVG